MASVTHDPRIDKMHGLDRIGALAFVVVLWVTILFTIISIWSNVQNGGIRALLLISGALVLLFNTASIVAMLRHYTSDKHFIYGLDLKHLDEMRRAKRIEEGTMAYQPPQQSLFAQVIDVAILVILTVGSLYVPLYLGLAGAAKTPHPIENPTWEALNQNAVEQQQWAALGVTDPAAANDIVTARFDYTFSWAALIVMAVVVIGYFVLVVRLSDKEYREVISERFAGKP